MKRLLLSTALILGTLTGVMGADQALTPVYQTLHEIGQSDPNWDHVKAHAKTLKASLTAIDDAVFFRTQATIYEILNSYTKDKASQAPYMKFFAGAFLVSCATACVQLTPHQVAGGLLIRLLDTGVQTTFESFRVTTFAIAALLCFSYCFSLPTTLGASLKLIDSGYKVFFESPVHLEQIRKHWQVKLTNSDSVYYLSHLLACKFTEAGSTSEGAIKAKLSSIFGKRTNFTDITKDL